MAVRAGKSGRGVRTPYVESRFSEQVVRFGLLEQASAVPTESLCNIGVYNGERVNFTEDLVIHSAKTWVSESAPNPPEISACVLDRPSGKVVVKKIPLRKANQITLRRAQMDGAEQICYWVD